MSWQAEFTARARRNTYTTQTLLLPASEMAQTASAGGAFNSVYCSNNVVDMWKFGLTGIC